MLESDRPLYTFSSVFPGLPEAEREWNDESHYIDIVTAGEGIVSHRVRADELSPLAELDSILWHHDAPPFGFNLYMRWAIYRAAHEEGVRVFLNGDDGDSVVSHGYERFLDLALEERWRELASEVVMLGRRRQMPPRVFLNMTVYPYLTHLARTGRWGSWIRGTGEIARGLNVSWRKLMIRYGIGAFVPERLIEGWQTRLGRGETRRLRPEFARRVGLAERRRELKADDPDWMLSARRAHALSFPSAVHQYGLELTDSAAGAFGIEPCYPFFDRRLIEFCVALPTGQKLADGWPRLIQRRAMEGILPSEVQWRVHKGDLSFNFNRGLRGADREELETALFDEPAVLDEYLDMTVLRTIYQRFLSGGSRVESKQDGAFLYLAAVLARWLRGLHGGVPSATPPAHRRVLPAEMIQEVAR
jgi:asparagine synthase (glutamine-hydrolysing)